MSGAVETIGSRSRVNTVYWGMWAERAVVRALEIDPNEQIEAGLLFGQPTSHVTFTIARAIGYLAGTQRAPELDEAIRAWLDSVGMCNGGTPGARLGGLSWAEWADRASVMALEIEANVKVAGAPLHGQSLWEVAITIARAVACLAGTRRVWALPPEVSQWLQGAPRIASAGEETSIRAEEDSR